MAETHAMMSAKIKSLRDENAKLQSKPDNTEVILVENESRMNRMFKSIELQKKEIDTLTSSNRSLSSKNSALEKSVAQMTTTYEDKITSMKRKMKVLSRKLEDAEKERVQTDEIMEELSTTRNSLLKENSAL
eukprot:15331545-Ditylum_brightwellii.AAC.1